MLNRIFILLLLLALSCTSGYSASAQRSAQHTKIVHASKPLHASHKNDISHFGVIPEQRQAEEETVTSRPSVDTITSEYSGDPFCHSEPSVVPGRKQANDRASEAQTIAADLAAKKLFPFHSFL